METSIQLGFEVESGSPVKIPLRHMAVTGQTQESGKTTTLEALITRSGRRAVAFITKRGEGAFTVGRRIKPYFEERTDWQFIEAILESTMKQSMTFKQPWIVRACEGAHTLAEVQEKVKTLMDSAKRGMDQDMYLLLDEYLKIVVPQIKRLPKTSSVDLAAGLSVMDLTDYSEELQQLVIASTLRWIHERESEVIIIVPEAWQFVPQGKNTPVKTEVRKLARLGAGLKNYLWIDSQDMAAVDKEILRACPVWIIGVQREHNEVKRALKNMAAGMKKPKAEDISRLGLGHFFACWSTQIHHTYVQPVWLDEDQARAVATGTSSVEEFQQFKAIPERKDEAPIMSENNPANLDALAAAVSDLTRAVESFPRKLAEAASAARLTPEVLGGKASGASPAPVDLDELAEAVSARLPVDGKGVDVEEIIKRVLSRIPTSGVMKIEPKEVVLKRFQQAEVERLLSRVEGLTPWQKQVLTFVEAKGAGVEKVDLLRLILGKKGTAFVADYKQRYKEADELASLGFLRKDTKGRLYPNLAEAMNERLREYNATEKDIEDVIGQVLLKVQ
jgi:hypothetical protein